MTLVRHVPRWRDEVVLEGLKARVSGKSWPQVAQIMRTSTGAAQQTITNVRKADLAESGEPADHVNSKYW